MVMASTLIKKGLKEIVGN